MSLNAHKIKNKDPLNDNSVQENSDPAEFKKTDYD